MTCEHLGGLRPPRHDQIVYRDECCTCFHSQDSANGIDVCLTCFQAGCIDRKHNAAHHELFPGHNVVLNIQRTPKEVAETTKVAVNAETDADRYEYRTQARCIACQTDVETEITQAVMSSLSSAQQSEVKAWEQEMTACEHTLTLHQEDVKETQLTKCSQCDLQENLWLCLVCGTLSCGRAQFGGGGGNGHGLQHVEATSHSLAVKLGSITPDGTADVYCYACDEERIDPMLQDHLSHWGIKLADRQKTEKSLQEMQLEQNIKWEFSMTTDDGKEMTPISGPGFTGMKNIGNSCYIASIMQSLFSFPTIQAAFHKSPQVISQPAESLELQMQKLADGLLSGVFQGIAPSMIKSLIGKGHAEFSTMRQQDAYEFLLYLLEKLETVQRIDAFKFTTEQRMQCLGCRKVAYTTSVQEGVTVLVPARKKGDSYEAVQITELLDIYTAEEQVEYTCSCSNKGATKRTLFKRFPQILVLNPGRFAIENWVPRKLEIPLLLPEEGLDLSKYISQGRQPGEESLDPPKVNTSDLEQLMAMGFPQNRAEKALLSTKSTAEAAMEWLFAHMEDPDIDEPFKEGADPTIVASLTSMGFPDVRCQKAALATSNSSVEAAMEWLMQHMDDPDIDEPATTPTQVGSVTPPPRYTAKALVCHKGSSVHAGHYVAYVKKEVEGHSEWILYNDEKVLRGVDWNEASRTAYVYFFESSLA